MTEISEPPTPRPAAAGATRPPPVVTQNVAEPTTKPTTQASSAYLPLAFDQFDGNSCEEARLRAAAPPQPAILTSEKWLNGYAYVMSGRAAVVKWHPITLSFAGPLAAETDSSPNPFLDYRLQVRFVGPSDQIYDVPGYFAGDGRGNGRGEVWQVRFAPDEAGRWHYCATFRAGTGVAIDSAFDAGLPAAFDGAAGEFDVSERDPDAPGFFKWGRLEYVGGHYFKFRDGPYWLKGGTNSPENFLGYAGFDNTVDQADDAGGFLHHYAPHVVDWRPGDPNFVSADTGSDARGIVGALNYLSQRHVNSIYFLPMNLGGDAQDTYPFLTPGGSSSENIQYDVSKLYQWGIVLEHAQRQGIALHIVLNEVEPENRFWLDDGELGVERKLFYRELVARFGYLPAIKWNLSEEVAFSVATLRQFADYISALDWADHPITIHNPAGSSLAFQAIQGDPRYSTTAFQYDGDQAGALVEQWRLESTAAQRPWVIEMDENNPAGVGLSPDNAGFLRRQILYDVYFSGAGGIEWYVGGHALPIGGDQSLEDFRTRERMWDYMWYARRFMEENLPFWQMTPADELLTGESEVFGGGEVLALDGVIYAVYLPAAEPAGTLAVPAGSYSLQWYDPRLGKFTGEDKTVNVESGGIPLNAPPGPAEADWVILVRRLRAESIATPSLSPYPALPANE